MAGGRNLQGKLIIINNFNMLLVYQGGFWRLGFWGTRRCLRRGRLGCPIFDRFVINPGAWHSPCRQDASRSAHFINQGSKDVDGLRADQFSPVDKKRGRTESAELFCELHIGVDGGLINIGSGPVVTPPSGAVTSTMFGSGFWIGPAGRESAAVFTRKELTDSNVAGTSPCAGPRGGRAPRLPRADGWRR